MSIMPFAEQGHYTAVHDGIFDEIMPIEKAGNAIPMPNSCIIKGQHKGGSRSAANTAGPGPETTLRRCSRR